MTTTETILISVAGFVAAGLVGLLLWLLKAREETKDRHNRELAQLRDESERALAKAQEQTNAEHLKNIEARLGFGSEKMAKLGEVAEVLKTELQADRLAHITAMETIRTAMVRMTKEFAMVGDCRVRKEEVQNEFRELTALVRDYQAGQARVEAGLAGVQQRVETSLEIIKDLTGKLTTALVQQVGLTSGSTSRGSND